MKLNSSAQLNGFIGRFAPPVAKVARACVAKLRKRLPGAHLPVYDNYNALAIGFRRASGRRI